LKIFLVAIIAECKGLCTVGFADLQVKTEKLLSIDEVSDAEIPLRTVVTKATCCQGYVQCMCLSGCSSRRCSCNSRSHSEKSWKNE
ncbi:hypothetical protein T4B_13812, partial [Trichinella pseudospiralis]